MQKLLNKVRELTAGGARALVVLECGRGGERRCLEALSEIKDAALVLGTSHFTRLARELGFPKAVHFRDYVKVLGTSNKYVVIDASRHLRPNVLVAAGETVVAGGALILAVEDFEAWNPGIKGGSGAFAKYLKRAILECGNHIIYDVARDAIVSVKPHRGEVKPPEKPSCEDGGDLNTLCSVCATKGQWEAVKAFVDSFNKSIPFILLGDRGRGKSFALGLATSYLLARGLVREVYVTAPERSNVESFLKAVTVGLDTLGVEYSVDGDILRVGRASIAYVEPYAVERGADAVVVDEAAAVSPARLTRIMSRARWVAIATTTHGYEGSGRYFAVRMLSKIERKVVYELKEPIRYLLGDPLEEFFYKTFMLDVEPEETMPKSTCKMQYVAIGKEQLTDARLLRKLYGILVLAHYRNEPDDLMTLLDAKHHFVRALRCGDSYIGVAQVALEELTVKAETAMESRIRGIYVLDKLCKLGIEVREGAKLARIVRIAVHPALQRRGYGSRLLSYLERELRGDVDLIGAVFSGLHILPFWVRNGYVPIYLSPRYNKVTGEKNVAVVKPLSDTGKVIAYSAAREFKRRLLLCLASIYRDVEAEHVYTMLLGLEQFNAGLKTDLTNAQMTRLRAFLAGKILHEQALDAIYAKLLEIASGRWLASLSKKHAIAVIARVLQGKSMDLVASALATDVKEAEEIVDEALRTVLSRAIA